MPRFAKVTLTAAALAMIATPMAAAQQAGDNWNQPYGMARGEESSPYTGQRGRGANRVVINGIIQTGVGVSAQGTVTGSTGLGGGVGGSGQYTGSSATAIANQLNVVVNGNYNTVVVNSRQINNGDVTANASSSSAQPRTGGPLISSAAPSVAGMESAGSTLNVIPQATVPAPSSDPNREP
ncbi:holdfast anchoring protein HfaA [Glycocaulis sp.]|uniref:holdfast anchoring protein HfaA n=1 Tax=Glycocaulis sp. TaxID=1969725 RepID=UPI003F70190D